MHAELQSVTYGDTISKKKELMELTGENLRETTAYQWPQSSSSSVVLNING